MWSDASDCVVSGDSESLNEDKRDVNGKCYTDSAKHKENVFNELIQECKHSAPGARLSARLRTLLERMAPDVRREVACCTKDGCAPLFVACKRGNVEIVEYLINVCNVDIEQTGMYEVADDRTVHCVTPLWCAAVSGRLDVLTVLVSAGADVEAASDSGSTPVRSACFMTHVEVVRFLVESGANIHRPNHNGGTCLINSVQSVRLCRYLLECGAYVDAQDIQLKTALHYAVQEHRLETARLLLEYGANPLLVSRAGDDSLQTAALKGAGHIFAMLVHCIHYSQERLADAYELLGSTLLDDFNDVSYAVGHWRRATAIRQRAPTYIQKRPEVVPRSAFRFAREFRTMDELEVIAMDVDLMRTQSLLICERVLGLHHKDTVFRLMYRGASYADAFQYQRCIDLWMLALEIRIEKDTLLFADTCYSAQALVRLMLDARGGRLEGEGARELPRHQDALKVYRMLAKNISKIHHTLEAKPVYKKQTEMFDRTLKCVTHLIYLLIETADDEEKRQTVYSELRSLVSEDIRSAHTGDTILHLCCSRLNLIKSTYFADEFSVTPIFPHCGVVAALLECGADVNVRNESRSTALHVASIPYNFSTELVEVLLAGGAHIDQPNRFGDLPSQLMTTNKASVVKPLRHMTLACLAATALVKNSIQVSDYMLPHTLTDFLDKHRPV